MNVSLLGQRHAVQVVRQAYTDHGSNERQASGSHQGQERDQETVLQFESSRHPAGDVAAD